MTLDKLLSVVLARDLHQPRQRLDGLALAKVVAEGDAEAGNLVVLLEPIFEQPPCDLGRALVPARAPSRNLAAELRHQQQPARSAAGCVLAPAGRGRVVLDQVGRGLLPRPPTRNLRKVLVVGDDRSDHGYFTPASKACEVSLPKMSITLTKMRCLPGLS